MAKEKVLEFVGLEEERRRDVAETVHRNLSLVKDFTTKFATADSKFIYQRTKF